MRLLVTRPQPEAARLKVRLEELGHEVTLEPLLTVSFDDPDPVDVSEAQAIIATSRIALRALEQQPGLLAIARGLPLYVVGRATAADARKLGFEMVITGAGTGHDLIPQIIATLDPSSGPLVHITGDRVAADLAGELRQHGFQVDTPVVYRMLAAGTLSDEVVEQIGMGEIEGVILLSPRTAAVYVRLLRRHGMASVAARITHYCLSKAIAAQLAPLGTLRTEIADAPNLEEVLALLT